MGCVLSWPDRVVSESSYSTMVWGYIIAAVVIFLILKELIRLPTVGKYCERYVFITGCDTGFGNMLAKRLDSLGFNVFAGCLTERGEDELRKVSSDRLKTLSLDVTKIESINKAQETVEKQLPPNKGLWAIVNNAGVFGSIGQSDWLNRSDYEQCLRVNLFGMIDVTRSFQSLVRKGQGRIVNISSVSGRLAIGGFPYTISKHGVEAFSDCLRREVLKQGITVHILEPGVFKTNIVNVQTFLKSFQTAFNQASPETQRYYGTAFFEKKKKQLKFVMERLGSNSIHHVVDAYTHAITAMFPRYRYLVGNDAKYFYRLLWNLPECISDRLVNIGASIPAEA